MRIVLLTLFLAACGGGEPAQTSSASSSPSPAAVHEAHETPAAEAAEVGPEGPEDLAVPAIASIPTDADSIAKGEKVFQDKGCGGCHAFGSKLVGPDLVGVTKRRTPTWIEKMVRYPDKMTKEDPVAKDLYRSIMVQMSNQGVEEENLPYLIAYLNSKSGS